MKAIAETTTLVLAGAFNPAILSPKWVAEHGLGTPPNTEFQVEILAPVGGGQNRFTFDNISYSAGLRSVTLFLNSADVAISQRAIVAAATILEKLPHTPVGGLGFNFAFLVEDVPAKLRGLLAEDAALLDSFPVPAETVTRRWGNTVKWGEALVNVDCEFAGEEATITVNFHYSTQSAPQAEAILRQVDVFATHQGRAVGVAEALTGQQLEA